MNSKIFVPTQSLLSKTGPLVLSLAIVAGIFVPIAVPVASAHGVGATLNFAAAPASATSVQLSWNSTSPTNSSLDQHNLTIWYCVGAGCDVNTGTQIYNYADGNFTTDTTGLTTGTIKNGTIVQTGLTAGTTYSYKIREKHGGDVIEQTATNIIILPTTGGLIVKKVLINSGGGTAATTSFSFGINGVATTTFEADGQNDFINRVAGAYSVVETAAAHYNASYSGCSGTIVAGATSTCTITNTFFNNVPVANNSSVTTNEDTATSSVATATDADSDSLLYAIVSGPLNALSFIFNTNGTFSYTPSLNYNGPDSFTFSASDVFSSSVAGTVSIAVNPINDNPDAVNDSANVAENSVDNVISVLANDSILPDAGETLSISSVSSPSNGTAVIDGTTVKYTPNAGYVGADSFTYTISDGNSGTDTATVNVTVSNTQDAPVAVVDGYSTVEDTALSVTAPGVLGNDSDADVGDTITAVLDTTTTSGTLALASNGSFTYTPNTNFNGADSFTYHAIDNNANVSNTVTVSITVTSVNDAPVSTSQTLSTAQNVAVPGVLGATDVDSLSLTFATTSNPTNGTITFFNSTTGNFTYTPNNNFVGSDSFNFQASDGSLTSNISTVTINVSASPENTPTLCSDGIDNDNDGLIDLADPDCASFIPAPPTPPSGRGGGGEPFNPVYGPPAGSVLGASTGQVLGAACGLYMNKHLRYGSRKNDVEQTKKLQAFLNKSMNANLPETGFFGPLTSAAVKAYQAKYADEVLKPWGTSSPTGLVYLSTLRHINNQECRDLSLPVPALIPWSQNPNAQ